MTDNNQEFRVGMVAIVGRPNVGKSTLLNELLSEKVAIVSKIPQTTRNQVRGIYNDEQGQIIFIDTPGLHMGKDKLDQFMNKTAYGTTQEADCIIHLVDTSKPVGREEEEIVRKISFLKKPVVLGLNKVDLGGKFIPEYISLYEQAKKQIVQEIQLFTLISLSGQTRIHLDQLYEIIFNYLPQGPLLYPRDIICDVPQRMTIADIVREKLYESLRHELPHSIAVLVEDIQPRKSKALHIYIVILVEHESQKIIVVGKKGQVLKRVGISARKELEDLMEKKIFLEIFVKINKKWRDNASLLGEMGYQFL